MTTLTIIVTIVTVIGFTAVANITLRQVLGKPSNNRDITCITNACQMLLLDVS